jgi:transposase-like protein
VPDQLTIPKPWSRRDKLAARRMYLIQGLSPSEIARKLDRTNNSISTLASRQGWAKLRSKADEAAAASADEQATAAAREFTESLASNGQELTEAGFDLAREAAAARDAKGFVMAASGVKIFAQLARVGLGIEGATQATSAQPLTVVFYRPPDAAPASPEPVNVTPAADVDAGADDLEFA